MLTKQQQQSIVRKLMPYNPSQIGIFGSYARGKEDEESDLDLLISLRKRINLFELMDLEEEISAMLGVEVDLVTDKSINKYMEPYIRKDIIYIFDDWERWSLLKNILDCIHLIYDYTDGMGELEFISHSMARDAVIRNFEIIGEAAKLISASLRAENEHIPWKRMAGMRDKLIHNYMGVDFEIVWSTINDILPSLEEEIENILE